jgi:PleD family two-component response regulator
MDRRRVLIAAASGERESLGALFACGEVEGWEAHEADSFEQARFLLQHDPGHVLLVDESLYRTEGSEGLAWMAAQQVPLVFLAGEEPATIVDVIDRGIVQWLPRDLAVRHPGVLAALLNQAAARGDLRRSNRLLGESLQECRRQVRRLVTLLWGLSPIETHARWFTQRHMMERLQEEIARLERHGSALCVVLGEVRAAGEKALPPDTPQLTAWTAERLTRHKRRTDVGGQYGPNGFILLLAHTSQPGAVQCCRRLKTVLEATTGHPSAPPGLLAASFGISTYSSKHATAERLLGRAEDCLEHARREEEGQIVS